MNNERFIYGPDATITATPGDAKPLTVESILEIKKRIQETESPKLLASESGLKLLAEKTESSPAFDHHRDLFGVPIHISPLCPPDMIMAKYADRVEFFNLRNGKHMIMKLADTHGIKYKHVLR